MSTAPVEATDEVDFLDFTIICEIRYGTYRQWLEGHKGTKCDNPATYQADIHYVMDCTDGVEYLCTSHKDFWLNAECPRCGTPICRNLVPL